MGDSEWFQDAVSRFEGTLCQYALRLVRDHERARDIVQDTFVQLLKQPRASVEVNLSGWLYAVCRNRALDVLKKEQRVTLFDPQEREEPVLEAPAASDALELQQTLKAALGILETLPKNQKEVIRLKFQHDLSYREISEVTGLSVSNVGYLMHVGLKTIRQRLSKGEGDARRS